tara:strand:- start:1009 stop:2715 length:1707 start_codon:yes stop_codon:yes gene_type:complete
MKITGFPTNIDINPRDFRELAFVKDFRNAQRETGVKLNVDDITIVREAHQALLDWLYNTIGRFENIPANVLTDSGTNIPMYLDLSNPSIGLEDATVGIDVRKSDGHFFTNANLLTFEAINKSGFFPAAMKIRVPYIIVPDDLHQQRAITVVTTLSIFYQIIDITTKIIDSLSAFSILAFGIGYAVAKAVALAAMLVLLIIQLQVTLNNLKELYFPNLRFFKAIRDVDLIRQGCAKLGYTLESNLLDIDLNRMCTMGAPESVTNKSIFNFLENEQTQFFNKGYPTAQDSVSTLGDMIKFIETTFNAKTFVYNGVVKIERRSYFQGAATIRLKPTLTDQDNHDDRYTFNESEVWGRMYDHWEIDYTDTHSPDQYDGMKSEYITEPITTLNSDLVRLIGLKENAAPFALAGRKNVLTKVDELVQDLFGWFYELFNTIGGVGNSIFSSNIGVMVISQQYFSSTKKLWLDINQQNYGVQPWNYKDILSMDNLFNLFKQDLKVINNNYAVKTMTVPFTDENFISLLMNNFVIYEPTGQAVEVTNITWFDAKSKAEIEILLPDASAFNTKTTKLA